jgi:hypothetical protein
VDRIQWIAAGMIVLAGVGCTRREVIREQPIVVPQTTTVVPQATQPTQPTIIVQSDVMPAPRVEERGPPPNSADVWVAGHWEKTSRGWEWHPGHWESR